MCDVQGLCEFRLICVNRMMFIRLFCFHGNCGASGRPHGSHLMTMTRRLTVFTPVIVVDRQVLKVLDGSMLWNVSRSQSAGVVWGRGLVGNGDVHLSDVM